MNKQEAQKRLEAIKREAEELEKLINEEEPPWYAKLPANTPVECKGSDGWSLYYAQGPKASSIRGERGFWPWSDFTDIRMPEQPWWDNSEYVTVFDDGSVVLISTPNYWPNCIHEYRRSDHE